MCDGLKGLPDSVGAVFPAAIVQTCVIHLIRGTFRYASRKYWDQLSKDLKSIYQAPTVEAAAAGRAVPGPKGTGQTPWAVRWKPALKAFAITSADRMPAAENN